MTNKDDTLQKYLKELENGVPLPELLSRIPDADQEIILGLRLAASIRSIPHPEPLLLSIKTTRQRVTQAARQQAASTSRRPLDTIQAHLPLRWSFSFSPAMAVGIVATLVVLLTASIFGIGTLFSGTANAKAATLMDVTGLVEVASSQTATDWKPVNSGDQVKSGERIHTYASSTVTLVFNEGTRSILGPDTDVTLSQINTSRDGVLKVKLTQSNGNITNSVVPLKPSGSFIVQTPSGNASVKGTHFDVSVANQLARFSVISGKVLVSNDQSEVALVAGQATATLPGEKPEQPAYQFSVQGTLLEMHETSWVVDNVSFQVTQDTVINGNPKVGNLITVQGRILEDGSWVADLIDIADSNQPISSFTGVINSIDGSTWQISGLSVQVDQNTQLSAGIEVGDAVRVTYITQPETSSRLAQQIELLQAEPAPDANPELSFLQDEINQTSCATDYDVAGTLSNQATNSKDIAESVDLGSLVERGSQYIQNVVIQPYAWDIINPGQSVNTNIHITLNQSWTSAPNGAEVKVVIFVAHETNNPKSLNARLVITLNNNCQKPVETEPITTTVPSPVPSMTNTVPSPSPVPPTSTITTTATTTDCVGANPQPKATKLADEYNRPYDEIMGWFCQGFGFGEIDLAYNLAMQKQGQNQNAIDVTQIFEMRKSGLGWGEIKQQLDAKLNAKPNEQNQNTPGNNKNNDKNKPNNGNNGNNNSPGNSNKHKP